MRTLILVLTSGLIVSALGCANLDEPTFCKTVNDMPVAPMSTDSKEVVVPMHVDVRPELSKLDVRSGRAFLTSVTLTPQDGVQNLSFLDHVTLAFADSGTALVDFQGATEATSEGTVSIPGTGAELFPAALQGPLDLKLTMQGAMPNTSWHLNAKVCVAVHARVSP